MNLTEINTTASIIIDSKTYDFNVVCFMEYLEPYRLEYAKADGEKPAPTSEQFLKEKTHTYIRNLHPNHNWSQAQIDQVFTLLVSGYALYKKKLSDTLGSHFGTSSIPKRLTIPRWKYLTLSCLAYCLNMKPTLDEVIEPSNPTKSSMLSSA